jgi:hypothetical protein
MGGEAGRELFTELCATIGINPVQYPGAGMGEHPQLVPAAHQLDFSNGKVSC